MFIAMNRFKVIPNSGAEFERVWTSRDTHLRDVPGFIEFHLLRGPEREDHVLYSSHTIWRSREDFETWTRSEAFRLAHGSAGQNRPLYLGHPEFEGFEVIQTVERHPDTAQIGLVVPHADRVPLIAIDHGHLDRFLADTELVQRARRADRAPQPGEPGTQDEDARRHRLVRPTIWRSTVWMTSKPSNSGCPR